METELSQILNLKTILESYSHIQLTEEEETQALIDAKRKKDSLLREEALRKLEEQNRKRKFEKFDFLAASTFFGSRSEKMFGGKFVLDSSNQVVFDMMCYYFNGDPTFVTMAEAYGVKNPSLEKGILFAGNFGLGKSWMLKLFMQNTNNT